MMINSCIFFCNCMKRPILDVRNKVTELCSDQSTDLPNKIFSACICPVNCCGYNAMLCLSGLGKSILSTAESRALSTSSQYLTNSGLDPIFIDDSVADQETSRVGCIFVTTSRALWQLVRAKCPGSCLLCLAIAYKASTKDG